MKLEKEVIDFLKKLRKNNNRDWFTENKKLYVKQHDEFKAFIKEIGNELSQTDQIEKSKVHRIYRDVRFSKDKTPYKNHFSASFVRATALLRGGYFMSIEPGKTIVGGGFYAPNKEDLLRIRQEFALDDTEIRDILNDKTFKKYFGTMRGDELKTAPRGFDAEHKAIDLIKKKSFYVFREFSDEEVTKDNFSKEVVKTLLALRPYFDYMSEVLTTNMNGESIVS